MGKITFILGGARSGKSSYAVKIAEAEKVKVAFIATCSALDGEMRRRIKKHKKTRPPHWKTFEDIKDIPVLLSDIGFEFDVIIIDCLTLFVSGFMPDKLRQKTIENQIRKILVVLKRIKASAIIVSNEVGLGIVPENELAREFRDIAGRVNQITARESDNVYFMVSGIPWRIK